MYILVRRHIYLVSNSFIFSLLKRSLINELIDFKSA